MAPNVQDATVRLSETLGRPEAHALAAAERRWAEGRDIVRLWARDKGLWTGTDEDRWLGWLDIVDRERRDLGMLEEFSRSTAGYRDVVLLGMGGSSLGPDVIAHSFGQLPGRPRFRMLDSTDPDQIGRVEGAIDKTQTLFIVSSKSGTTLEPNILKDHFFARVGKNAGRQFAAVTDPGSAMEREARALGFAHLFHGDPAIGGRYSVLSKFGLVPAAAIGVDVAALLASTAEMVKLCGADVAPEGNLGVRLGRCSALSRRRCAATRSRFSPRHGWPTSAPGSSNCSRN